jgi:hypothetical protein
MRGATTSAEEEARLEAEWQKLNQIQVTGKEPRIRVSKSGVS